MKFEIFQIVQRSRTVTEIMSSPHFFDRGLGGEWLQEKKITLRYKNWQKMSIYCLQKKKI